MNCYECDMYSFITLILSNIGVKFSHQTLKHLFETHFFDNSLYSIAQILSKYNVASVGVRFSKESVVEDEYCPFVAQIGGLWTLVTRVSNDSVFYYDAIHPAKENKISKDIFIGQSNGKALLVLPDRYSGELNYVHNHLCIIKDRIKKIVIFSMGIILVSLGLLKNPLTVKWSYYALLALNILGLVICFLLLQKQLNISNRFTDKLCSFINDNHCDSVTDSAAASVLGMVKLSEIGFGFFTVNLVVLLFVPQVIPWLAVFSVCVLPFSFWSIWYQRYRVKSWCTLCLIVLAVMWIQSCCYFVAGFLSQLASESLIDGINCFVGYVFVVLMINYCMQVIEKSKNADYWKQRYESIKSVPTVIDAFMGLENGYDISPDVCSAMIFGDPDAERTITVFSNPYCGPCGQLHNIIKDFPGGCVKIQYVMTYFSEDKSAVNKAIIAAYSQLGWEKTWEIMTEWYKSDKKDGVKFFERFGLNMDRSDIEKEFKKQKEWPMGKNFRGTPTILVNGRELQGPYTIEDYFYLPR